MKFLLKRMLQGFCVMFLPIILLVIFVVYVPFQITAIIFVVVLVGMFSLTTGFEIFGDDDE